MDTAHPTPLSTDSGQTFDLRLDSKLRWVLVRPGLPDVEDVRVRRAFPWSMPERFVSIRGKDGKELLMVDDLRALRPGLQDRLRQAIRGSTFIPRIHRIVSLELQFGHQEWEVETDRGTVRFRVQEREDIKMQADGRMSVKDADGNVYELPAERDMDPQTLKLIQQVI